MKILNKKRTKTVKASHDPHVSFPFPPITTLLPYLRSPGEW